MPGDAEMLGGIGCALQGCFGLPCFQVVKDYIKPATARKKTNYVDCLRQVSGCMSGLWGVPVTHASTHKTSCQSCELPAEAAMHLSCGCLPHTQGWLDPRYAPRCCQQGGVMQDRPGSPAAFGHVTHFASYSWCVYGGYACRREPRGLWDTGRWAHGTNKGVSLRPPKHWRELGWSTRTRTGRNGTCPC